MLMVLTSTSDASNHQQMLMLHQSISEAREIGHPFISQEDLRVRAKVGKAVVEKLAEHGALGDLPETDQIDLF